MVEKLRNSGQFLIPVILDSSDSGDGRHFFFLHLGWRDD